ncbi:acyclic terpene utilization AtuA family protein [Neobacillus mesonae]|uniref:acyclic terpene utilization AtuA family protein n=1 Tax=Neobacillus mesonae TaxID=1193713 RepID=UPI0015D5B458
MFTLLRIGTGAGFAGDRLEPAQALVEEANLDYLILEGLAERTIALSQKQKRKNPNLGYNEYLEERIRILLPALIKNNVRLITNMGAANAISAAQKITEIAGDMGLACKVASVTGDDVLENLNREVSALESGINLREYEPILSANAYLGIDALLPALSSDANIIVTGRAADPSLFLAPIVHHYNWNVEDFDLMGQGTLIGHLLECAGQITGGYFADPGYKDVEGLANLGFPFAIVEPNGSAVITKLPNTGGMVSLQSVKEQLLYEVHDPENYYTPDCVANFSTAKLKEIDMDQILVYGATGKQKPDTMKVSVGYHAGYLGEGEISYAGSTALARGELAEQILKERLKPNYPELRTDLIGVSSLHHGQFGSHSPYEVRVRAAALCKGEEEARRIGHEVEALYTNGPAAGGGVRKRVEEVIGIVSTLIERKEIAINTHVWE